MTYYRNVGAPFTSEFGYDVGKGDILLPTDADLARRWYKLRAVGIQDVPPEVRTKYEKGYKASKKSKADEAPEDANAEQGG